MNVSLSSSGITDIDSANDARVADSWRDVDMNDVTTSEHHDHPRRLDTGRHGNDDSSCQSQLPTCQQRGKYL